MMEKSTIRKVFAIAVAVMLISVLTLSMMRRIPFTVFWIVAAFAAVCAYLVMPKLK